MATTQEIDAEIARRERLQEIDAEIEKRQGGVSDAVFEPTGAIVANLAGFVGSGLAGITELLRTGDINQAVDAIGFIQKNVAEKFAPQTEAGKSGLRNIGAAVEAVQENIINPISGAAIAAADNSLLLNPASIPSLSLNSGVRDIFSSDVRGSVKEVSEKGLGETLGDRTFEATGSPTLSAIATAAPEVADFLIPSGAAKAGARKVRAGAKVRVQEANRAIDAINDIQSGKVTDEGLQTVADTVRTGSPEEIAAIVRADPEFFRAADELGITTEPLAAFASKSPQFRDVSGALQKVPGSVLDVQARDFIIETANKADELITQHGGTLDKAQLGLDFKAKSLKTIEDLADQADDAYGALRELLPEGNRFETPNSLSLLRDLASKEKIPSRFKKILNDLTPKQRKIKGKSGVNPATGKRFDTSTVEVIPPTLGKIDQTRREVGQAIHKGSGPFKDVETGLNKALYARLTRDQDAIADASGLVNITDSAKALVSRRKQLEDNLQFLLGKDLNQALNVNVSGAIKNLQKGEIDKFNQIVNAIPKQNRGEVVMSAMNDVFKGSGVGQQQLGPTQFTKWYQTINRSPAAKKALFDALPVDSKRAVDNLFEVSRGISRALGQTTPTGRINAMFNPDTGFIRKMVGRAIPSAVSVATGSPAAAFATNAVSDFLRQGSDGAKAASDLMGTAQFQNLIRQSVKEGVVDGASASRKLAEAESKLMKSKTYQKWVNSLAKDDQAVLAGGFLGYAFGQQQEQE